MGFIYLIKNTVNDKCYIGLTTTTPEKRFKKHISMAKSKGCYALYSAFEKYGVDKFSVAEIASSNDKAELMRLEADLIEKHKTLSPSGYNLTTGGESCIVTDETKKKISKSLAGRSVTWGGKVSESVKKLWESKEYRDKQVEQRKLKRGPYKAGIKKPLRLDLPIEKINELYNSGMSIYKISKIFNVPHSTIKRRIK